MRHFLSILFGAAFTCATAWALGSLLFARLRIRLTRREHELLAGVTGAALLSLLIFALSCAHLDRIPVFWAIGLGAVGLAVRSEKQLPAKEHFSPLPLIWKVVVSAPFVFFAVVYLSNSMAPENSPDGATYHLGVVYRFYRQHGFDRVTTNMYSSLPEGMEMLFLYAFLFGRHAAAATLHCCCLFALPLMIFSYGARIGRPYAGACAGMLCYLSPLMGIDGVSAYNDVAMALTCFATFYLLEIWREENNDALLIPIGLVAGFCFAIKYTGFTAPLYAVVVIFWERGSKSLRPFLIAAASATLLIAPWLIKNWLWVANPLSPFANGTFRNPFIHITFETSYRQYFRTYELKSLKPLFWNDTVSGTMGGQVGPIFLLTPLALLSLRFTEGRRILTAFLFFMLSYPQNIGSRFLLQALPFAALGIALALEFSRSAQAILILAAAPLAWPRVIDWYRAPAGGWSIAHVPWKAALGIIPQDTWLTQNSGGWVTARMIDQFVPEGGRVWSTSPVEEAYTRTDVLVYYYSAESELIQDILTTAVWDQFQPRRTLRYTFPSRALTQVRLVQHATSANVWSISEVKFFSGGSEIPRSPKWHPDAFPFPWDFGLAFDNNPATRWRTWEPIHDGMWIRVDFGSPVTLDRIDLTISRDEDDIDITPDGISAKLEKVDYEGTPDIRRNATAAVKARGVGYLLITRDNWLAPDMFAHPEEWGLKKLADCGDTWLFKIE